MVAAGLAAGALLAQDQLADDWARVSAPPPVTNMGMPEDTDARRIDGRWWTKDNREVVRTEAGIYRVAARDPNYRLYHLRPMDPAKANQLHLYMTPNQVMDLLGNPNDMRVYREGQTEQLRYLAADGTATQVLVVNGLVADVRFEGGRARGGARRPAAIEKELHGLDPVEALRRRLNPALAPVETAAAEAPKPGEAAKPAPPPPPAVPILPYIPPPPETNLRTIPERLLAEVTTGETRTDLLSRLGKPNSDMVINGNEDGPHETLSYKLDTGAKIAIRLVDQKVVEVLKP